MFDSRMHTSLAQRLVSIVSSVFDQTWFSRLASHFNISMFGHQTIFDGVWLPNIYRLSRPLTWPSLRHLALVCPGAQEWISKLKTRVWQLYIPRVLLLHEWDFFLNTWHEDFFMWHLYNFASRVNFCGVNIFLWIVSYRCCHVHRYLCFEVVSVCKIRVIGLLIHWWTSEAWD